MTRIQLLTLLLAVLTSLVASSPPTFCKCTCNKNSTIIPLGLGHEPPPAPAPPSTTTPAARSRALAVNEDSGNTILARAASSSCTQCNRAFCLQYNLPICQGVEEKDVVTQCFARDSRKDQLIVWAFILGTGGLLGWAGLQRALEYQQKRHGGGNGGPAAAARSAAARRAAEDRGDYVYVEGDADHHEDPGLARRAAG